MTIRYQEIDLSFYYSKDNEWIEGDFELDATGDLALTSLYQAAKQDVTNRIRTQRTDWRSHRMIGGNLELLEGEPNTKATAEKGKAMMIETLLYDGRFSFSDLSIRAVPIAINQLQYYVFLNVGENQELIIQQAAGL